MNSLKGGAETRILIVEDDRFAREYILEWLKGRGYEVFQAADGLEALEVFQKSKPDLVLLDLGIPKLDGLQVLERLTARSPETPVIIVSGRSDISAAIRSFTSGAWDYITKPIVSLDYLDRTIRNCLERKKLKEDVKQAEERYRELVENLPVIIFILTSTLQLEFINKTCQSILGYTQEEAMEDENWFLEHIHPEDRDRVTQAFTSHMDKCRAPLSVEFRFEHKKGYLVHLLAKSIPTTTSGEKCVDHLEGMIMDVTEHNFLDTVLVQKEKLNTLGAMSAELAHEIRNPLVPLAGFAKRLKEKNPDMAETNIILEEATRLEKLLDRITEYLKPVPVQRQECSVNSVLRFCLDMLGGKLAKRSIHSKLELDDKVGSIYSDPDILTQIFINLISSAIESVKDGGELRVITAETRGQTFIDLIVSPVGAAIRNPELLLLPFEQEEKNYSVAVSYRLVKNVGGYLSFQQNEESASYRVTLPKEEHPEKAALITG